MRCVSKRAYILCLFYLLCVRAPQVVLDDKEEKVYTLTAAQADEGEGTEHLKLRNVKGQGGVRVCVPACGGSLACFVPVPCGYISIRNMSAQWSIFCVLRLP